MNERILITGTRKGIGKSIAEYFLEKGASVFGCSRGESSIDHEKYFHAKVDVGEEKGVASLVRKAAKHMGGIDILINNAGIASMNHMILTPAKSAQRVFNTNFMGTFLLSRECAKIMMRKKHGRIVNFTTVAVPLMLEGEAVYAASKAAVESLTRVSARELSVHGITVNAIGPTPVETDLIRNVPENKIQALLERQAVPRFGTFDDIINVIEFFIDKKSDFVTGQVIYLGGV